MGYPPFDNILPQKDELVREWVSMFGDLPTEWGKDLPSHKDISTYISIPRLGFSHQSLYTPKHQFFPKKLIFMQEESEFDSTSLRDWLHQTYFEDDKKPNFSRRDINTLGDLLDSMLQYRPSDRPQASDLLKYPWLRQDPFDSLQK